MIVSKPLVPVHFKCKGCGITAPFVPGVEHGSKHKAEVRRKEKYPEGSDEQSEEERAKEFGKGQES